MTSALSRAPVEWSCDQIEQYRQLQPRYRQYATTLREVLDQAVRRLAPFAIVQTRPKAVASFAEKIQRKWPRLHDPVHQFTDLCGGRVITFTQPEVKAVCAFILEHFEIDWENSVDVSQRLKPAEFGYRSVHYIVQFKPGVFPTQDVQVTVPVEVFGLKAEVQVRTLLEHAWAGFGHDRVYKSTFAVPEKWQRELAGVAAMLEQADESFSRVEQGLQRYAASYGAYMTEEEMREELALLENVQTCDPDNPELAHRIGKLAMTLGEWQKAVEVLEKYKGRTYEPIVRDLGVSLCKLHKGNPAGPEYRLGQQYLQQACESPNRDPDALASLAGTWKDSDPEKARSLYRQAFEVAPTDPYAVGNYLAAEIAYRRDLSPVPLMTPAISAAVQRCRDQVEVGMNLPWAYYDLGVFHLVLNQPYSSLTAYAKAIQLSSAGWFLATSLQSLGKLEVARDEMSGYEWATRLLAIALVGSYGQEEHRPALQGMASPGAAPTAGPVVIVAGGCDASSEGQMKGYRPLLLDAFSGFQGTVVSGGTTAGICGLVGDIQEALPSTIQTIGYTPELIPIHARIDDRYRELRQTAGHDFDALGPLQCWTDIVVAGITPNQVKLVGIGGGAIAAVEYRIALALGAQVAIIEGSGRSAAQLLSDGEWNKSENLVRLPADTAALRSFLAS
jgi:ppGpp synthetase/RelA/SpoT-type nucleotidyltranferase